MLSETRVTASFLDSEGVGLLRRAAAWVGGSAHRGVRGREGPSAACSQGSEKATVRTGRQGERERRDGANG